MTVPVHVVRVALGVADANTFTVGDATNGRLGNSVSLLGDGLTTVTSDVVSVTITRGSQGQLGDQIDPGRATIVFNNEDRKYDPSYTAGTYFGELLPGREIRIRANDILVFQGYVDDWDVEYDIMGRSTATVMAIDGLAMLADTEFDAWSSTLTTADGKLNAALDRPEVNWAGARSFDPGLEDLQSHDVDAGTNVVGYLQQVAESDLGALFAAADGTLSFRNRLTAFGASEATFSDDGSDLPFHGVSAQVGSDVLAARVVVEREGGVAQTQQVDDLDAWTSTYGPVRTTSRSGLLLDDDAGARAVAAYLLDRFQEPVFQFRTVTVKLHELVEADQNTVLGLDVASVVTVEFTPNGVGSQVVEKCWVRGVEHSMTADEHEVTLQLVSAFPTGEENNLWDVAVWDTGEWV